MKETLRKDGKKEGREVCEGVKVSLEPFEALSSEPWEAGSMVAPESCGVEVDTVGETSLGFANFEFRKEPKDVAREAALPPTSAAPAMTCVDSNFCESAA